MKQKIMKGHVLLTWLFKQYDTRKSIHQEIEETLAERKKILVQWEKLFLSQGSEGKDIHEQLRETITEFKRTRLQQQRSFLEQNKKAA
ncbi:MAG TPA: hypothetical protein VJ765_09360 [Chitinophagaceae bacterium]|nr:hypothetical protein [Chitinophagaceae bacterium]